MLLQEARSRLRRRFMFDALTHVSQAERVCSHLKQQLCIAAFSSSSVQVRTALCAALQAALRS